MSNCIFLLVPFNAYRADSEDYINVAWKVDSVLASEASPLPFGKSAWFLPRLLVLGCILDNFFIFLPQLLDLFYNFAPDKV